MVPLCQWKGKIKSNPYQEHSRTTLWKSSSICSSTFQQMWGCLKTGYQGKSTVSHVFPYQTCHLGCIPHFQTHAHIPTSSILFLFESMLTIPPFDGPSRFSPANEPPPSWTISRKPDSRITADGCAAGGSAFWLRRASVLWDSGCCPSPQMDDEIGFQNTKP